MQIVLLSAAGGADYLLVPASIIFWIFSRLNEPGVWLGGYSFMVSRNLAARLCIGMMTKGRSRNQSL